MFSESVIAPLGSCLFMRAVSCVAMIAVLCFAAPATLAAEDQPTTTYRLMAYNVGSAANLPLGPRQIGQIADTIIDYAIDIAGFAEMELGTAWHDGRDHVAELGVALAERGYPMHVYKWPSFEIHDGWQTPAIFSRFPIEESGYDVIPPPGGFRWCVGHVTVNVAENTPIRAYMTHFWPQGDPNRQVEAVRQLTSVHKTFDGPATIMGDFNLSPASNLYKVVQEQGWRNSCEELHGKPCPSVQGTAGISGPLPLNTQIDYIFRNNRIEFVDTYVGYFSMSDHWPVIAEVRVPVNGPRAQPTLPHTAWTRKPWSPAREKAMSLYRAHRYSEAAPACFAWEKATDDLDERAFAAYSAGCMWLLANEPKKAYAAFSRIALGYPDTEWSTRCYYQLAFIYREQKAWRGAEEQFLRFLEGYYTYIHPDDSKVVTVATTVNEIALCRQGAGDEVTRNGILSEIAATNPQSTLARSAAYALAKSAHQRGDREAASRYLAQADPPTTGRIWPDEARVIAEAYAAMAEIDKADAFHAIYLRHFTNPLHRRVRAARWKKQQRPESLTFTVPVVADITVDGALSDWEVSPLDTLDQDEQRVVLKPLAPVQAMSADVYIGQSEAHLHIAVVVTDDANDNEHTGADIFNGDCVQIAIDPRGNGSATFDEDDFEFGVARTASGVEVVGWHDRQGRDWSSIQAAVVHVKDPLRPHAGRTIYEISVPKQLIWRENKPSARIGFNVLVGYADGKERFGWIDWTPGIGEEKAPELFPVLMME